MEIKRDDIIDALMAKYKPIDKDSATKIARAFGVWLNTENAILLRQIADSIQPTPANVDG